MRIHKKDYWLYCHLFGKVICQPVEKELNIDPTISWTPKVWIWDATGHGIASKPFSSKHLLHKLRQVISSFESQVIPYTFLSVFMATTLPVLGQSGNTASSVFHIWEGQSFTPFTTRNCSKSRNQLQMASGVQHWARESWRCSGFLKESISSRLLNNFYHFSPGRLLVKGLGRPSFVIIACTISWTCCFVHS